MVRAREQGAAAPDRAIIEAVAKPRTIYRSEHGRRAVEDFYRRTLAEAAAPIRTRLVETAAARTHLIEAGPEGGDIVLLLHGSASNSATWLGDIPTWSRHFRVIAADLPDIPA